MIIEQESPHMALLHESVAFIRSLYQEEHAHTFDLDALADGRFFVARHLDLAIGCGAYVWRGADVEIKHMFVLPVSRGLGCGRALLSVIEQHAINDQAVRIVLETSHKQPEAIRLYRSFGYADCPPYTDHHDEDVFMMKVL
jgi:putative acetyltransferase